MTCDFVQIKVQWGPLGRTNTVVTLFNVQLNARAMSRKWLVYKQNLKKMENAVLDP
jgi:hypothetical protein